MSTALSLGKISSQDFSFTKPSMEAKTSNGSRNARYRDVVYHPFCFFSVSFSFLFNSLSFGRKVYSY